LKTKTADERALELIDAFLKLPSDGFKVAEKLWTELTKSIQELEVAVKGDPERSNRLEKMVARLEASVSKLVRSASSVSGPLREDWMRFAENDLEALKDELLALREFISAERGFLGRALRRTTLWKLGLVDPEHLFKELHQVGAISERTWILIMTHPKSLQEVKDREVSGCLRRIAQLFFELQEVRSDD
jgi:hypothetical protein